MPLFGTFTTPPVISTPCALVPEGPPEPVPDVLPTLLVPAPGVLVLPVVDDGPGVPALALAVGLVLPGVPQSSGEPTFWHLLGYGAVSSRVSWPWALNVGLWHWA